MPADDVNKRRAIINIFVHSIYLYDDNFTLIINASKKPLSIDNIPLDDIEAAFSGDTYTSDVFIYENIRSTTSEWQHSIQNPRPFGRGFLIPLRLVFTKASDTLVLYTIQQKDYRFCDSPFGFLAALL